MAHSTPVLRNTLVARVDDTVDARLRAEARRDGVSLGDVVRRRLLSSLAADETKTEAISLDGAGK